MSSNRWFLENVWKLLGISSSNGSTIKSSLEFLQKLKVLTENFQILVAKETSFPVLIQAYSWHFIYRIYSYFSKITETFS